jgi:Leucine-rich repeat (LRR) protein
VSPQVGTPQKLASLGIGALTLLSTWVTSLAAEPRVIHFPRDRSMGTVLVLDRSLLESAGYEDWQPLGEATADVTVPPGKAVRLDLSKEAGADLSPLGKLEPNDLQMLFCGFVELPDKQLVHIAHLTGLREVYLGDTRILGTGLKHLMHLTSLKKLDLSNTHVGDNELAFLVSLSSLQELDLWGTPTGDQGMVYVGRIKSLESLGLSRGVGDEGLAHLADLTKLRWLSGGSQGITDEGLAHLADLAQMESLDLRDTQITNAGLASLKGMRNLQSLCLYSTRVTEQGFVHLEGLQKLQTLQVLFGVTEVGLASLSKLPSLHNVTIDGDSLSAEGLALLPKMTSLEELYVDNTPKMDTIVPTLPNLPRLRKLTLGTGLTDEGLLHLQGMPALAELVIGPAHLTSKGLAALASLGSLKALRLEQADLASPDAWAALGKLSFLERLSLRHTRSKVTDACVSHLVGLQSLTDLSLDAIVIKDRKAISYLDVTDEGLSHIAKLKKLQRLSLRDARITDEGLQRLAELPDLKWLNLRGCEVTEEGLQHLKKRLLALHWYL